MSSKDHSRAPVIEGICAFQAERRAQFTTPGHKMGRGVAADVLSVLGDKAFSSDLAMTGAVDDRRASRGWLTQAQELAADAFDADETTFSTNGSSLSVHATLMAVAHPGEKVLIVRNMHKSVVAGLILSGVHPVYLAPALDEELELSHGIEPEALDSALRAHPDAHAVLVTSPTYYGVSADVQALSAVCHAHGIPVIVDEAWGAHFPFHPDLPPHAARGGADLTITSVHKTLAAFGEGSIIHLKGSLVDSKRLSRSVDLLESTSISSLILASLDGARRQMMLEGEALLDRTLSLARGARTQVSAIEGLQVLGTEVVGRPGAAGLDETKFVVDVRGLRLNGFQAADWLYANCRVNVELCDQRRILAIISIGDTAQSVGRLVDAMRDLAKWARQQPRDCTVRIPPQRDLLMEVVMPPREAFFAPAESVPLHEAVGRIAAEMLSPYPPGIPACSPGERLTEPVVEFIRVLAEAGMYAPDVVDPSFKRLRVVV